MVAEHVLEQAAGPLSHHGECPVWDERSGRLHYVDMLAGDLLTYDPGSGDVARTSVGGVAAAPRPRAAGGFIVAADRGVSLIEPDGDIRPLPPLWADETVRVNEGGCDPDGRYYIGSMAWDERPGAGTMYRIEPDGTATALFGGLGISNGFGFSPDGRLAYYVDTPTGRVDVFDYDSDRGLTGRRPLATVPEGRGGPDGLTVDADGAVWVALFGGSAVLRLRPTGELDTVIELPASQVTACTFGGADLDELYITTSAEGLPAGAEPTAGSLFRARVGAVGLPALPFAG